MGKSRLSVKSTALRRQRSYFQEDESRYENNQVKVSDQLNSSDNDNTSYSLQLTKHVSFGAFKKYVDTLYDKRESARQKALLELIDAFERSVLITFVETTCITILLRCINSIKIGSAYEACLASRVIGLLAITLGTGSNSHELMEESIPQLSLALESGSDLLKISVVDCLAITTFFGTNDAHEVEKSMEILWEICHPEPTSTIVGHVNKPTSAVLAAAISAWSFLLTTIDCWRISTKMWKESVSILFTLLGKDDSSVHIAAGNAIGLIFETGRLDKFCKESDVNSLDNIDCEPQQFAYVEFVKKKILNQVKELTKEAEGKSSAMRDFFQEILVFLETGALKEMSMKIPNKRDILKVSTWTQTIQLKFFERFLGRGFRKHMEDNEVLHDILDFGVREKENPFLKEKTVLKPPITTTHHKERTQLRNKQRMWAQDRHHGYGHYNVVYHEE